MKFKTLDLFSGLGGFSLGLERTGYFETIAFCDNDKYSKLIIDKHWKGAKIYNDVREINKEQFKKDGIEFPEIITGGFPCQPFSVAGKKQGTSDDRHLWPEMFRIIQEFTPRWIIGENVKNITNIQDGMVFETVCTDLEGEGYEVRAFNIPAAGVGAPHRRERIWIVAHSKSIESDVGRGRQHQEERERQLQIRGKNSDDANTDSERLQGHRSEYELRNSEEEEQTSGNSWWSVEPNVGRVANGVSGRVYRLKGLGNSIVPKIAEEIGKAIVEAENEME
jgi:DNA (cytosine-5)-methyltransferase 1